MWEFCSFVRLFVMKRVLLHEYLCTIIDGMYVYPYEPLLNE